MKFGFFDPERIWRNMTASERLAEQLHLTANTGVVIHDPANIFYLTEG